MHQSLGQQAHAKICGNTGILGEGVEVTGFLEDEAGVDEFT